MKTLISIIVVIFASCLTGREEIQVKSTFATVLKITTMERFGQADRLVFHLQSENGIRFTLERPMVDSSRYLVGERYPFLAPR